MPCSPGKPYYHGKILKPTLINREKGFEISPAFKIPILLWVDDVISCTEGRENQIKMMNDIDDFAIKHKLEWSIAKCKVMRVGTHKDEPTKWKLGNKEIEETEQYKYLGDEITSNGRNTENIKSKRQKIQATTATINTIASNEVLNRVESLVLLELHERITIPTLLNNAESWTLNKSEIEELERVEVQALKSIFKLPLQTPNAAVMFTFGTLYTKQRIDQIQLLYLHKVLNRSQEHWTQKILLVILELNIGWAKSIKETLCQYDLPSDLQDIKRIPKPEWKRRVKAGIESKNKERLIDSCYKEEGGNKTVKTKTASIIPIITSNTYKREPQYNILTRPSP